MDFSWTPEQQRFRQELHDFILREMPSGSERGEEGHSPEFSRKLGKAGWIGSSWPVEYGGRGLGAMERLIYSEEMVLTGAPIGYHHIAERQMGPSIIMFGTEEQKRSFLPRIAAGECAFCIGYSEPNAGSDLASLTTRAVQDGDDYIVNGAKVWNSAHRADYIWLATRTDPDVPKHKGISVFLVDLKTPGITIQPILNMANHHGFNLVTFENARVPGSAMVGERDRGWYVAAGNLDFERSGIERVGRYYPMWQEFLGFVREAKPDGRRLAEDALVRHRLAEVQIEFDVGRLMCYNVAYMMSQGKVPNIEASASKVFGCETSQRMARAMFDVMGLYGQLEPGSRRAPLAGRIERTWMTCISLTIAGGTSEVMRNIIAQRGLGLPRG
ncbi:MAG: acyl-CoA dehydrogenase family protein [Chloroflexi bacterium]|nr:acyl-CoA dehydrogenase family protein [Chloroflexota bacterium]